LAVLSSQAASKVQDQAIQSSHERPPLTTATTSTRLTLPSELPISTGSETYARLKAEVSRAGILDRSLSYYLPLTFTTLAAYALSAWAIVCFEDYVLLGLACLSFTVWSVQLGGLMHDSGHRAVFTSVRLNNLLGYASSACIGMVWRNWLTRHNAHHARPNDADRDPDLETPFIATTREQYLSKPRFQRKLGRWQVFYYYPLLGLVSFTNRLGSLSYFLRHRSKDDFWRLCLYLPGIIFLFVLPFAAFPLEKAVFVLLLVHVSTGIYLANCFAPNHKGMPVVARGRKMSFIEQQVITSRNVRGGLLTDFLLLGLNHQVEHHLFPSCPRNKLRLLKPYVRRACEELGLDYAEESFLGTNRLLIRQLRTVPRMTPQPGLCPEEGT
jgi:fatty acid desaturase